MVGIRTRVLGILTAVVPAIALDTFLVVVAPTAVTATYVLQNGAPVYLAGPARGTTARTTARAHNASRRTDRGPPHPFADRRVASLKRS
jgi:hypothetical protein